MAKDVWWIKAIDASDRIGWYSTVILAQWQLETGNFLSSNFLNNNNIAGQTWASSMGDDMRGTPRPASEGGYYIKYADPIDGYVDFITKNSRYRDVKNQTTEEAQIQEIARQGWAVDPNYAASVYAVLKANKLQGYTLEGEKQMIDELKAEIESLKGRIFYLEETDKTVLNTLDDHISRITTTQNILNSSTLPSIEVPDWADSAIGKALNSGVLTTPQGSYDFYRIITVMDRLGLFKTPS